MRHLTLFFGLVTISLSAFSQQELATKEFNEYYRKSIEKLQELYIAKRGASFECDSSGKKDYSTEVINLLRAYKANADKVGIIFYSFQDDTLRIWLCRKDGFYGSKEKVVKEKLLQAEEDLRRSLKVDVLAAARTPRKRGTIVSEPVNTKSISVMDAVRHATNILLPERIALHLRGLNHLMVIPEFNIGQFPFYVLQPFGNKAWLIDSLSVSFAPHLCNLEIFAQNKESVMGRKIAYTPANPLIVGNPVFATKTDYILPSLKGAEKEALQVASLLNRQAFVGNQASFSKVVALAKKADLIYFATHGFFDMQRLLDGSFLAFAPDSSNLSGLWTAKEIQKQKLIADLAVLSACQTGVGKIYAGGFIGIGRAFFIAGVSNTIISLWSVDDASTQKLMLMFVENLLKEDYFFPAGHLRKAILEYKKNDPDPAHWAPFMDFGFPY